jgi:hypothetical protein
VESFIIFVTNISGNIKIHANTTEPVKPRQFTRLLKIFLKLETLERLKLSHIKTAFVYPDI